MKGTRIVLGTLLLLATLPTPAQEGATAASGASAAAIDDADLLAELARIREALDATRRDAEAAAEREQKAEEMLAELEARLSEIDARRQAADEARQRSAASAAGPQPAEGEVEALGGDPMVVTANSNLRAGPGLNQAIRRTLPRGTEVQAFGSAGQWIRVRTADGLSGWIYAGLLEAPGES